MTKPVFLPNLLLLLESGLNTLESTLLYHLLPLLRFASWEYQQIIAELHLVSLLEARLPTNAKSCSSKAEKMSRKIGRLERMWTETEAFAIWQNFQDQSRPAFNRINREVP